MRRKKEEKKCLKCKIWKSQISLKKKIKKVQKDKAQIRDLCTNDFGKSEKCKQQFSISLKFHI